MHTHTSKHARARVVWDSAAAIFRLHILLLSMQPIVFTLHTAVAIDDIVEYVINR